MSAIGNTTMSLRRQIKNVAHNYSEAQIKVREATSNDPWGPSSSLMSEIADMTHNAMAFTEVMQMLWKRLNDSGKNWRHVYKSLVVLDYLIKVGSEKVAHQCRENIFAIQTLKDFQHIEDNKDQGMNVREKAKQLVSLLKDEERLKNERTKALMAKKRFSQHGVGIGSDGTTSHVVRRSESYPAGGSGNGSELEECRPSSVGEEELQLQIALALSREEAEKEEEQRKSDDVRLQLALHESKDGTGPLNASSSSYGATASASARATTSAVDDLLSLQVSNNPPTYDSAVGINDPWASSPRQPHVTAAPPLVDPWGTPMTQPASDPWSSSAMPPAAAASSVGHSSSRDPWGGAATDFSSPVINDPWASNNNAATNDPFYTNGALSGTNGYNDPFVVNNSLLTNSQHQQRINELDAFLTSDSSIGGMPDDGGAKFRNVKTPETFLGENSTLVNLDNLMGPSKPLMPGMPPSSKSSSTPVTNPFLPTGSAGPTASNPFALQQRPSPTLNEMKVQSVPAPLGGASGGAGWSSTGSTPRGGAQNSWNLPQPLEPARPASTNPFLS